MWFGCKGKELYGFYLSFFKIFDVSPFIMVESLSATPLEAFASDLQEHRLGVKRKPNALYSCSKDYNSPQHYEESSDSGRLWEQGVIIDRNFHILSHHICTMWCKLWLATSVGGEQHVFEAFGKPDILDNSLLWFNAIYLSRITSYKIYSIRTRKLSLSPISVVHKLCCTLESPGELLKFSLIPIKTKRQWVQSDISKFSRSMGNSSV